MRKRVALIHEIEKMKAKHALEFEGVDIYSIELFMDEENKWEIIPIIVDDPNRFKLIVLEILKGRYNDTLYRKEEGNVTAMKFMHKGNNSRIYCLEITEKNSPKKIVMARGFHKKSEGNNKTNKPIIKAINGYQYELKRS